MCRGLRLGGGGRGGKGTDGIVAAKKGQIIHSNKCKIPAPTVPIGRGVSAGLAEGAVERWHRGYYIGGAAAPIWE